MSQASPLILSVLKTQCPHCREGFLFKHNNPYNLSKPILDMHDYCPVCNQKTEIETGFWWGTGYVSYGLSIAVSVATVIAFSLFVGWKADYSFLWYLISNALILVLAVPYLVRLSRTIWMALFVHFDANWRENKN
jgi:hypothetical protein